MLKKTVSFVVPAYNEASNVKVFYERLVKSMEPLAYEFEIIFIDDGSEDKTLEIIEAIRMVDKRVKYLSLSRNFGHQNALTAGLDHAKGDCVISMDGDLQHPPELVPQLLKGWEEGYEIVYTHRKNTADIGWFKRMTANAFYSLMNAASEIQLDPNTSDFRLMDRKVVEALSTIREHERFYRGLVKWVGFKQKRIDFDAERRFSGEGKYTLFKMLKLAAQGLLSYSYLPLYAVIFLCFTFIVLSMVYAAFALWQKFVSHTAIPGQASILLTILLTAAVQLFALAILSVYVLKGFRESRKRPVYIVREKQI